MTPILLDLFDLIINEGNYNEIYFTFHNASCSANVYNENENLRKRCSADDDDIPVWLLKPVSDAIASLLTHIINVCREIDCLGK